MQVGFTGGCGDYSINRNSEIEIDNMRYITTDEINEFIASNASTIRSYLADTSKRLFEFGITEFADMECTLPIEDYSNALLQHDEKTLATFQAASDADDHVKWCLDVYKSCLVAHILSDPITDIEYLKKWQ
jgi:hypothetical protein